MLTTTLLILYLSCNGFKTTTICIVLQFGLAIILSVLVSKVALTSGTINFFVASIRHALLLSITVMPADANFGAHSKLVPPPALKIAIAGLASIASCILTILYLFPLNSICLPIDFSDATAINSVTGKLRSAKTCNIFVPTKPVAPTTATFM